MKLYTRTFPAEGMPPGGYEVRLGKYSEDEYKPPFPDAGFEDWYILIDQPPAVPGNRLLCASIIREGSQWWRIRPTSSGPGAIAVREFGGDEMGLYRLTQEEHNTLYPPDTGGE